MVRKGMPGRASTAGSGICGAVHGSKGSRWFWGLQVHQAWAWAWGGPQIAQSMATSPRGALAHCFFSTGNEWPNVGSSFILSTQEVRCGRPPLASQHPSPLPLGTMLASRTRSRLLI